MLQININRFGISRDGQMMKINSRCEFNETLDFDRIVEDTDSYLLSQPSQSQGGGRGAGMSKQTSSGSIVVAQRNVYKLHAILCHSGTLNSGHYFCYIKAGPQNPSSPLDFDDGTWVKFNDQNVTRTFRHVAIGTG